MPRVKPGEKRKNLIHPPGLSKTELSRRRKLARPGLHLLRRAKVRANINGLEFSLTEKGVVIPSHCPALGIGLTFDKGISHCPSLDRIDNSKGYIPGNIVIVSWKANKIKSNCTVDEIYRIGLFYGKGLKKWLVEQSQIVEQTEGKSNSSRPQKKRQRESA